MELDVKDATNRWSSFLPGVTTESCFLFNLPESSTNRHLHTLLLQDPLKAKKAPTLQMLQLAATITCEKNKINAFCMRRKNAKQTARLSRKPYDFNNRFSNPPSVPLVPLICTPNPSVCSKQTCCSPLPLMHFYDYRG